MRRLILQAIFAGLIVYFFCTGCCPNGYPTGAILKAEATKESRCQPVEMKQRTSLSLAKDIVVVEAAVVEKSTEQPLEEDSIDKLCSDENGGAGSREEKMIAATRRFLRSSRLPPNIVGNPCNFKVFDNIATVDFYKCGLICLLDIGRMRVVDHVPVAGYISGISELRTLYPVETGLDTRVRELLVTTSCSCGTGTQGFEHILFHISDTGIRKVIEYHCQSQFVVWYIMERANFIPSYSETRKPTMEVIVERLESDMIKEENNWEPTCYERRRHTDIWEYDRTRKKYLHKQ